MSYRVIWRREIRERIPTDIFLAYERGRDPDAIARAVAEIDLRLGLAPADEGESRAGAERVLIVSPLTVVYEVFEAAQTVLIYGAVLHPGRWV